MNSQMNNEGQEANVKNVSILSLFKVRRTKRKSDNTIHAYVLRINPISKQETNRYSIINENCPLVLFFVIGAGAS